MTVEFHDQQGRIFHQEFQKWRRLHPRGYFLTFSAKQRAQLHTTLCWHSGTSDWTYEDFGASLTTKRKICADSYDDLLAWATREGVAVSRCAHCLHEQASVPSLSASPTQAHSVVPHESEDSDTFQDDAVALEGIARETTVITRSRSERLRRAARERAQGICEACALTSLVFSAALVNAFFKSITANSFRSLRCRRSIALKTSQWSARIAT